MIGNSIRNIKKGQTPNRSEANDKESKRDSQTKIHRDRQTHRNTDRQTERQTDSNTQRQTNKQTS